MSKFINTKFGALKAYIPGEQPRNIRELVKLNTNESPFPPSPRVAEALCDEQINRLNLYSDPASKELIQAISHVYGLNTSEIFVGNGSDEILAFCFHVFCENGIAFSDLSYGCYCVYAAMFGAKAEIVPLREDFTLDVADYYNFGSTVIIANPNAPTGLYNGPETIENLLRQNPDRLVIIDEAYIDFGGQSVAPLIKKYDNLLVVQTFSKSRSLAGARLGTAFANAQIIEDLNKMKDSFNPYNVNHLTQAAAKAALEDTAYFDACRRTIIENRTYTLEKLRAMRFDAPESKANFIFAKAPGLTGKEFYEALRSKGVLVRYFEGERTKEHVRISIGTKEQMDKLLQATIEILEAGK